MINGWRKRYPISVFPSLWNEIDTLIGRDQIWSVEEVYRELRRQEDELFAWAKARRKLFRKPTARVLGRLTDVMKQFPNFAARAGAGNRADPFIIAEAIASDLIVVTDEAPLRIKPLKATKPPKIPDVCEALGVKWASPTEFFQRVGFSF